MGNRLNFSWWHTYLFNRCDPSLGTQIDEEYQKYLKVQNTCTYSSVNDGCSGDIDGTAEVTWTNLSRITDLVNVKVAMFEFFEPSPELRVVQISRVAMPEMFWISEETSWRDVWLNLAQGVRLHWFVANGMPTVDSESWRHKWSVLAHEYFDEG